MRLLLKPNLCMGMEFASDYERAVWVSALRFDNPNPPKSSEFNPYYDGKISFWLDSHQQKFPTGFLGHMLDFLGKHGITPQMEIVKPTKRIAIEVDSEICDGMKLRDYQLAAVKTALQLGRGIVTAPPRSGKTLMQAALAKTLGYKSVMFVEKVALLEQHVENLRKWGLDPGIVQGSQRDFHKTHCVAMLQTVWANHKDKDMMRWLESIEVMQVDECHHSSADTYYRAALLCPASWRIGYSGTPFSVINTSEKKFDPDIWKLVGLFGPPIVDVTLGQLQDLGLMVPVQVIQIKHTQPEEVANIDGNQWQSVYSAGIVENDSRNLAIATATIALVARGYLPLVLVKQVGHGEALFEMMRRNGLCPLFAKGSKSILTCRGNPSSWIRGSIGDAYKLMLNGGGNVLIATQIGDEGVDFPHVNALVLAVGGKADQVTTQRLFRPLTATDNKTGAVVIDFDDRQHGVLKKHSAMRRRIYKLLGFEPRMMSLQEAISSIPALLAA